MCYNDVMPQTPEERRKSFEALSQKRQQMIDAERARQEARARGDAERSERQGRESIAEQAAAVQRGEEREEWRQEQHVKRQEAQDAARRALEEEARLKAKKEREAAEDAEKTKDMRAIHERAVAQKTASRKLQARHIEEETDKHVGDQLERDLRDVQRVLDRTLEHLTQDRRRKIANLDDTAERQVKADAERFAARKKDALRQEHGASLVLQLTAEFKRSQMTKREQIEEERAKIESEYNRLKDEATALAAQKTAHLRGIADRRFQEAKTRHENMDDWIDSHRGVK